MVPPIPASAQATAAFPVSFAVPEADAWPRWSGLGSGPLTTGSRKSEAAAFWTIQGPAKAPRPTVGPAPASERSQAKQATPAPIEKRAARAGAPPMPGTGSTRLGDPRKRTRGGPAVEGAEVERAGVMGQPAVRTGLPGDGFDRGLTDLMLRFQASRDPADFEQLYRAAAEDVLNWIRSLLRQASHGLDALELLQDTFVNVYRYPSGFRSDHAGSFRVWVRTIAGNAVRRARRRSTQRTANLEEQLVELTDPCASPLLEAYGREASEHMGQALLLLYAALNAAYGRLKERDRQALELVELNGQSYADAGPLLGVPAENMKMIVFRARRRLVHDAARALAPAGSGEHLHGLLRALAG